MIHLKRKLLLAVILLVWVPQLMALVPERRSKEDPNEFGWFAAPTPFKVEGIGQAVLFFGLLSNVYETTDLILIKTFPGGDFDATGLIVDEMPLFTKHFQINGGTFRAEIPIIQFSRGIDSDPDDYIQPLLKFDSDFFKAELLFWEERLNVFYQTEMGESTTLKVFDNNGNLISEDESTDSYNLLYYGFELDLTDDRTDPRSGVRVGRFFKPTKSDYDFFSDIMVTDTSLTGYVPLF